MDCSCTVGSSRARSTGDTSTLGPRGAGNLRAMADRTQSTIEIAAEPGAVLDVIADFELHPEWAHEVTSATLLSEDGDGWADQVEFHLNAGAIKDHYVLEYDWDVTDDGTGSVSCTSCGPSCSRG